MPPDYSQRIYGYGGLMPRFAGKQKRGAGFSSPMFVYRWDMMRELLERHQATATAIPTTALMVEYVDPTDRPAGVQDDHVLRADAAPGRDDAAGAQTASLLVAPFEGTGYSIVDGQRFDWTQFDTLAVPGGSWCEHVNGSDKDPAILFVASDEPTLKTLDALSRNGAATKTTGSQPGADAS